MLKNEYSKMGGNYQVVHHSELLLEFLAQNKLKIKSSGNAKTTYHDPCYLGRYNQIYEQPRQLLKTLNSQRPLEMAAGKQTSFCCGGGGGVQMFEKIFLFDFSHYICPPFSFLACKFLNKTNM